jgi:ADP-heptose:LPS heptosyltransferase
MTPEEREKRIDELLRLMFAGRPFRSHYCKESRIAATVRNPNALPPEEYERVWMEFLKLARESLTPQKQAELNFYTKEKEAQKKRRRRDSGDDPPYVVGRITTGRWTAVLRSDGWVWSEDETLWPIFEELVLGSASQPG